MAAQHGEQNKKLAEPRSADENRAEDADLTRLLVDWIKLTPNADGELNFDLYGDLAGILTFGASNDAPLDESDASIQQVKLVAGVGFEPTTFRL
jgi:site-specific DNA recombinase